MNVQNVGLANLNFGQKVVRYSLSDIVENYGKLPINQKACLKRDGLSLGILKAIRDQLAELVTNDSIGNIGNNKVRFQYGGNLEFEIGPVCKLLLSAPFINVIKSPTQWFEFDKNDILKGNLAQKVREKIVEKYQEIMKNMTGGMSEEFYHSKTLDTLFTPEFKVEPQKTDKGYLTTIINKQNGKPEKVYIEIQPDEYFDESGQMLLFKDRDDKHFATSRIGEDEYKQIWLGALEFYKWSGNPGIEINVYGGGSDNNIDYSGVGYRLIQALIEYLLPKDADIYIDSSIAQVPFYTKAGFTVNPKNDKFVPDDKKDFLYGILSECDSFGIPREQFEETLIRRSKGGIKGFGTNEAWQTFCRLLYQKGKSYSPTPRIMINHLELTRRAKKEWLERIKSQPIFPETQDLIEKGII